MASIRFSRSARGKCVTSAKGNRENLASQPDPELPETVSRRLLMHLPGTLPKPRSAFARLQAPWLRLQLSNLYEGSPKAPCEVQPQHNGQARACANSGWFHETSPPSAPPRQPIKRAKCGENCVARQGARRRIKASLLHKNLKALAKYISAQDVVAETKGFEPSRPFRAYSLSRGAPSTTRPRLR